VYLKHKKTHLRVSAGRVRERRRTSTLRDHTACSRSCMNDCMQSYIEFSNVYIYLIHVCKWLIHCIFQCLYSLACMRTCTLSSRPCFLSVFECRHRQWLELVEQYRGTNCCFVNTSSLKPLARVPLGRSSNTCIFISNMIYVCLCMCACIHIYICIHIYMYTYIYTHVHTHTNTHTHV